LYFIEIGICVLIVRNFKINTTITVRKMQFDEGRYQPSPKRLWNYLKRIFYYHYFTYDIPKSRDTVRQLLATYFKKLDDNKRVRNIYGEMPGTNSLYMEYIKRKNYLLTETFDLLSPTCLKGTLYSSHNDHTQIEIGVRVHSNYLIFFILAFVAGIVLSFNLYKKSHTNFEFLVPFSASVIIMTIIVISANIEKDSLRKNFEEVIGAESLT
jgi:hypothetical protein